MALHSAEVTFRKPDGEPEEDNQSMPQYWVSVSRKSKSRMIHRTGACWHVADVVEYSDSVAGIEFNAYCTRCFDREPSKNMEDYDAEYDAVNSSVATDDESSSSAVEE